MKLLIFSIVVPFLLNAETSASIDPSPLGNWMVSDQDAKVEVYEKDGLLEGKIIWLKEPLENGKERIDSKNPDEKLRSRPVLNMIFLTGFKKENKENKWSGGIIYDAKSGKTYKAWMKPEGDNKLTLRGYVGISIFGRTEEWTRSP